MSNNTPVQPRAGIWFFALPLIIIPALVGGYGVLLYLGYQGEPAVGARVTVAFETCAEAGPVLQARVDAMGLGEPLWTDVPGGFTLEATMPANEGVASRIPATLAEPGLFELREEDEVVFVDHIESATMRMDFIGEPSIAILLDQTGKEALLAWQEAHGGGQVTMYVDGVAYSSRANTPKETRGQLTIRITDDDRAMQVERVAALALVMGHPLPCEATVR